MVWNEKCEGKLTEPLINVSAAIGLASSICGHGTALATLV